MIKLEFDAVVDGKGLKVKLEYPEQVGIGRILAITEKYLNNGDDSSRAAFYFPLYQEALKAEDIKASFKVIGTLKEKILVKFGLSLFNLSHRILGREKYISSFGLKV